MVSGSLGAIIRALKSSTTLRYHHISGVGQEPLWQRNYNEHIIRSNSELERISRYITDNPLQWELDRENPQRSL